MIITRAAIAAVALTALGAALAGELPLHPKAGRVVVSYQQNGGDFCVN
jgi:hypothetical protein